MLKKITRTLVLMAWPFLWSCASVETRPAVDASLYLLELETSVNPQLTEFDPSVAKGAGSGMLRGAGMGAGGCIYAGASIDAASAGSSLLLGTILGIVVSPACALVGGLVGGGIAESSEDVATRLGILNVAVLELGYPEALALMTKEDISNNGIYEIHQPSDYDAPSSARETTPDAMSVSSPTPGYSGENDDAFPLEIMAAKISDPILPRPVDTLDTPNATLRVHITNYGFEGSGVDPKLSLRLGAEICVIEHNTGSALLFQKFSTGTTARKLEDWAELGKDGLEAETQALITRLASSTVQSLGRQVKLGYKTSCSRSRVQKFFMGPS